MVESKPHISGRQATRVADIYLYLDYHQWLSDAFTQKKAGSPAFSHRNLANRLGLKSSCYVLYVMQGKRKLTEEMASRLAVVFQLSKRETEYFLQLIRYSHAKSAQEKQFQYRRILSMRKRYMAKVSPKQYRFYEKWYYPVVREALALEPFTGNYQNLADMIVPSVTAGDIREAITVLEELDILYRDGNGVYHKRNKVISTGEQWESGIIHAHQRELLALGAKALEQQPRQQRDISHCMFSASGKSLTLIKQRIAELHAELMEIGCSEEEPDRVLQCNIEIFPTAIKTDRKR